VIVFFVIQRAAKVTKKECRSKQNDTHFRALIFVSRSVLGQHQILPFQKIYGFICLFLPIWLFLQCNDNMNIFEFDFEEMKTAGLIKAAGGD